MNTKSNNKQYSILLALPILAIYIVFFLSPKVVEVFFSFTRWDIQKIELPPFIGFENYVSIFTLPNMSVAIKNTILFAIITSIVKMFLGLGLALFLNKSFALRNTLRTIFYLPAILNAVVVGATFSAMMHPNLGLINRGLRAMGLDFLALKWLADPYIAMYSICFIEIWMWSGVAMTLLLAALQTVSNEYYEAADIDGASAFSKFYHITIPLILPVINNCIILGLIGGMKVFDLVFVTTQGGPGYSTQTINMVLFNEFGQQRYGNSAAVSVVLTLVIGSVVLIFNKFLRGKEVSI